MIVLLLLACGDLTPGEAVLGEEVPAAVFIMEDGQGRVVGLHGREIVTADPPIWGDWRTDAWSRIQVGSVWRVGHGSAGAWAWLEDGRVISLPDGKEINTLKKTTTINQYPSDELVAVFGPGENIACGTDGLIFTSCQSERCVVHGVDGLPEVSPGGALGFWSGHACWGDPMLDLEQGRGRIACSNGDTVRGKPGDHLGLSFAGGRAAGRFNRHLVPPRLRIVSLNPDDQTWVIDSAAENSRVGLAEHLGTYVVGVPGFRRGSSGSRMFVVEAE